MGEGYEGQKALAFQRRIKTKEETLDCLFADMVPTRYREISNKKCVRDHLFLKIEFIAHFTPDYPHCIRLSD